MKEIINQTSPDESSIPKKINTTLLPEGWYWSECNDGSGSLISPEGNSLFIYDKTTYWTSGWIEYSVLVDKPDWNIYYNGFIPFKEFAEKYVIEKYLL